MTPHPQPKWRCCDLCKNIPCKPLNRVLCASHSSAQSEQEIRNDEREKMLKIWGEQIIHCPFDRCVSIYNSLRSKQGEQEAQR